MALVFPPSKKARPNHHYLNNSLSVNNHNNNPVALLDSEFRAIKCQFLQDNPDFASFHRFDKLQREYCRFMRLKIEKPFIDFECPPLIRQFWRAHILCTKEYLAFCKRNNSKSSTCTEDSYYIHHNPIAGNRWTQERYELTWEHYEKLFREKPTRDAVIWPKQVTAVTWPPPPRQQQQSPSPSATNTTTETGTETNHPNEPTEGEQNTDNANSTTGGEVTDHPAAEAQGEQSEEDYDNDDDDDDDNDGKPPSGGLPSHFLSGKHQLERAPKHASRWNGREWICRAKMPYQQHICRYPDCKRRIRTFCICSPGTWLCQTHFDMHDYDPDAPGNVASREHVLEAAPKHATRWDATHSLWICESKTQYPQYICKHAQCKQRVRTYCKCAPGNWLCKTHFSWHVADEAQAYAQL